MASRLNWAARGNLKGTYRNVIAADSSIPKQLWYRLEIDDGEGYALWFDVMVGGSKHSTQSLAEAARKYDDA